MDSLETGDKWSVLCMLHVTFADFCVPMVDKLS